MPPRQSALRRAAPLTVAAFALALVAGCSGDDVDAGPTGSTIAPTTRVLQGAAPGEANTTLTAVPEPQDLVTDADLDFLRTMLQHHAQALEMTALVPDRTSREDVPLFAERIHLSQEDEIALMQNWLRERGEPVLDLESGGTHGHDGELMPGMLTAEQLAELEATTGEDFDRLFLQYMYIHHDGALTMVEELLAADGAQDTFVFQVAKEIDADQRIEMDRIVGMLAQLGAEPLPAG